LKSQRASLAVLFVTIVINVLGIGIMLPVMPRLVTELVGGDISSSAAIYGWLIALYSLMQFLFGPTLGALSDRFGRRPIILISLTGMGFDYLLLAVAPTMWIVAVARIVGGLMGASISTATAYIADITPPERRAQNFGLIGVAFGVGFIGGPLIGGLLGEFGSRVPFFVAAGVCFVGAMFAFFFLPESLAKKNRRRFKLKEANPFGAFILIRRHRVVVVLLAVFGLSQLAERMLEATWVLYAGYRFNWGAAGIGLSLAVAGLLFMISQGGLVRVAIPKFGEFKLILFGLGVGTVSFALLAFAANNWFFYLIVTPYVLAWGLVSPAMQAIVTRAVSANEQGTLQGVITAMATATGVVAPPLGGNLFGYFINEAAPIHLPGVVFLLGSLLFLASLLLMLRPAFRALINQALSQHRELPEFGAREVPLQATTVTLRRRDEGATVDGEGRPLEETSRKAEPRRSRI
jgi:MFS transporter, DHA1 family, tetracycline resistance protein